MPPSKPKVEDVLAAALEKSLGVAPVREFAFHKHRRWRYDVAYPEQGVCIDINGHRSHRTAKARRNDAAKLNAATELGYAVFIYPAESIYTASRLERVVAQISRYLCGAPCEIASGQVVDGTL